MQVYDDEGLLACCALSETHIQTAGGGFGSLPGHDIQPGEFCPHHTRNKRKCSIWKWNADVLPSLCAYRSIWSCQCRLTSTHRATRTPAAQPAPLARTQSSPTMLEPRSPACQSSLPTPMEQLLRNADTSISFRQTLIFPPLLASWGWTLPHIPRDEANKHWCSVRKELGGRLRQLVGSRRLKVVAVLQFLWWRCLWGTLSKRE